MLRRVLVTACAVMSFAMFGGAVNAYAADVTLYEVTENMKLKSLTTTSSLRRQATSALTGTAAAGTPVCPQQEGTCTINALGSDDIDVVSGLGTFRGKWTSVVHGDNDVDAPEYAVASGYFFGAMDFSPALVRGEPYGTVSGQLTVGLKRYPFTGVFYMPFVWPGDPYRTPLYLGPYGPVQVDKEKEYSVGYPTVKFEITFTK